MVEVITTDEFADWFRGLECGQAGVSLGLPQSGAINGASFALRALRVKMAVHQRRTP